MLSRSRGRLNHVKISFVLRQKIVQAPLHHLHMDRAVPVEICGSKLVVILHNSPEYEVIIHRNIFACSLMFWTILSDRIPRIFVHVDLVQIRWDKTVQGIKMEAKMVGSIIHSKSDGLYCIHISFDARISTGTAKLMRKGAWTIFCLKTNEILTWFSSPRDI